MKTLISAVVVMAALLTVAGSVSAATLVIADFDSGEKPSNIRGDFGTWNRDESDKTQRCNIEFSSDIKHGTKGFSLQINYDVDSPNPAYNGLWFNLLKTDVSGYDKLVFWIKGDEIVGFSPKIKIELRNSKGEEGKHIIAGITKDWQQIVIPLNEFTGLTDLKSMTEIVITFDDITCESKKVGMIYIDDIAFVK